jgi:hypothetical protein
MHQGDRLGAEAKGHDGSVWVARDSSEEPRRSLDVSVHGSLRRLYGSR